MRVVALRRDTLASMVKKNVEEWSETGHLEPEQSTHPEHYHDDGRLRKKFYEGELARLQEELVKLQYWVQHAGAARADHLRGARIGRQGRRDQADQRAHQPAHRAHRGAAQADRARADPVVLPALRAAAAVGRRDRAVRPQLVQPLERRVGDGVLHRGAAPGVPAHVPRVRADARAVGDHPAQVLVLDQLRGAGTSVRGPQRGAAQALEAVGHGPRGAPPLRALLDGQGHHVPVHRHQAGARGTSCRPTTSDGPGSTASATSCRSIPYEDIVPDPVEIPEREDEPYIRPPIHDQTFVPQLY